MKIFSQLNNIDPEDIEDLLHKVETSFNIQFTGEELLYSNTFGQLTDCIAGKIQLEHVDDCTTQQSFYKLRNAISSTLQIDSKSISPKLLLADFLPREDRKQRMEQLENYLGFKLNILRPPHWVTTMLFYISMTSLVGLYANWQIGLLGIIFSIFGFRLADKFGNELEVENVRQLVEKITRENYLMSRRTPTTYNRNEIEKLLIDWFSVALDLDKSKLRRDAKLDW